MICKYRNRIGRQRDNEGDDGAESNFLRLLNLASQGVHQH